MIQGVVNQRVTKNNNMTERETLKLLQISVLTNIIPYNMDKMTPPTPSSGRLALYSHFT
jgi:hypothetical protein